MATLTSQMGDQPIHMEDLMGLDDVDAAVVDPQLSMPYFGNLSGKAPEQFTLDPSMWRNSIDDSVDSFSAFMQPEGCDPADINDDRGDSATTISSTTHNTRSLGKASRTSRKSSVPSLSSGTSSPGARQTRSKATKDRKTKTKGSGSRKKAKLQRQETFDDDDDDDDDPKRTKYLERNRIAASKCRQKKKQWVSDLEKEKNDLETRHGNLQREHNALIGQVTELKNELMGHASCGDRNIDSWIETEAKRFVQRTTTDQPPESQRRRSSAGQSYTGKSYAESFAQDSPPPSAGFTLSPIIKDEEINYDHMPDDMFDC